MSALPTPAEINAICGAVFTRGKWSCYMDAEILHDNMEPAIWELRNYEGRFDLQASITPSATKEDGKKCVWVEWKITIAGGGVFAWEEHPIPLDDFRLHCRLREVECFVKHHLAKAVKKAGGGIRKRDFWRLKIAELGGVAMGKKTLETLLMRLPSPTDYGMPPGWNYPQKKETKK